MAAFNKFYQFVEDLGKKVHNLASDQIVVALTSVAPVQTNEILANLTQISYTNLSGNPTSRNVTTTSCEQTSGLLKLILADLTLTASGGAMANFRYVVLYNDTPSSPADPLIGFYDYGAGGVTLQDTETFKIDFSEASGCLTLE
jgi:hypothetical protein